jgi:hypothetical protein
MSLRTLGKLIIITNSVFLVFLALVSNAQAQVIPGTASLSTIQYPTQVSFQNGESNQATLSFSVNYTYLTGKLDYVVAWITDTGTPYVDGTGTSSPQPCMLNRDTSVFLMFAKTYPNAFCIIAPNSGVGTQSFSFNLWFSSTGQHSLQVSVVLLETYIPLATDPIGDVWQVGGLQLFPVGQTQSAPFTISVGS